MILQKEYFKLLVLNDMSKENCFKKRQKLGFSGGPVVRSPSTNAGDTGLAPGPEDFTRHGATKPMHHY